MSDLALVEPVPIEGVVVPKQCHSTIEVGDQRYMCLIDWNIPHDWHEESGHNHEGRPYSVRWGDALAYA